MTKHMTTLEGKVWAGRMTAVPADVVKRLSDFVASCDWTGGGELEFVETMESKDWYMIDFNTRLPAWVGAGVFTGCNLPGDLIAHMSLRDKLGGKTNWSMSAYLALKECDYTKSIIEMPVHHINNGRKCLFRSGSHARASKGSLGAEDSDSTDETTLISNSSANASSTSSPFLLKADGEAMFEKASDAPESAVRLAEALRLVGEAADAAIGGLQAGGGAGAGGRHTPMYVLSEAVFKTSLARNECFFRDSLRQVCSEEGCSGLSNNSAIKPKDSLLLQMALSVKTQPRREVLRAAHQLGYMAECISMAEVRLALDIGFAAEEIILTGPGKFWETISAKETLARGLGGKGASLAGIYADSISDLLTILSRVNDEGDWLKAALVGVRFQPIGVFSKSRFGIDASDPNTLCVVADIIRRLLAKQIKLGVHLHFAASAPGIGIPAWFGMAKASASLATDFSRMCGRPLSVLDFGGGFPSHFIDSPLASSGLSNLFQYTRDQCNEFPGSSHNGGRASTTIQFELGKSITERSGGLVCTILAIREVDVEVRPEAREEESNTLDPTRAMLNFEIGGTVEKYAIIVDACVGEIGDYSHVHPLFWRPRENSTDLPWTAFTPGKNEIWGRTCMEFDVLVGSSGGWGTGAGTCGGGCRGVSLPDSIKPGDYILIGCCGAYDMR
jgi:diaminopimelate decarboxylase